MQQQQKKLYRFQLLLHKNVRTAAHHHHPIFILALLELEFFASLSPIRVHACIFRNKPTQPGLTQKSAKNQVKNCGKISKISPSKPLKSAQKHHPNSHPPHPDITTTAAAAARMCMRNAGWQFCVGWQMEILFMHPSSCLPTACTLHILTG
jgi:hypothetical protein